jgi:DNA mismatch repair protein MSH5
MKRTYDGLGDFLSEIATQLSSEVPEWARKYIENCTFFPQLGFLTVVPLDPQTGKGKYEGEGMDIDVWEKRFCSDGMGYYKNKRMRETDEYFGDMYGMICGTYSHNAHRFPLLIKIQDKEIEITHALAVKTLEHEALLISASDICGELDSLVALARGAQEHRLVPAKMTMENIIDIKGGRHPLQELTVASYVANDAFIQGGRGLKAPSGSDSADSQAELDADIVEEPSLLMMTGPNYSGKSVYLKQIALIVYMAHLGSFVPAESATIGITDKILTRIATRESISKAQSAFMIDLQQIALAMTLATNRSLIIIDEFGKGTNSYDGAGLACGVFEYFLSFGPERPKVLGATHFHEIFESGQFNGRPEIAFGHMEVRVDDETEVVEDQITYLYNFVPGRSTSSFGTCCAAMNGIDPAIIERAEQLILLSVRGDDLVAACSLLSEEATKGLEDAEQVARQFLEQNIPQAMDKQHNVEDVRRMLEAILSVGSSSGNASL